VSSSPLYAVAERENPLRRFLFVSTVLGKHLPIDPRIGLLAGGTLALQAANDERAPAALEALLSADPVVAQRLLDDLTARPAALEGPVAVLGFAETATALGHAVADAFDAEFYCHTTRRKAPGVTPALTFSEEHSHAPSQWLYDVPTHDGPVVLVDDELSTGKTACNLVAELQRIHPRERYLCLSLIDRLGSEERAVCAQRAEELGCVIEFVSLQSCRDATLPDPDAPAIGGVPQPLSATDITDAPITLELPINTGDALTARQAMTRAGRTRLHSTAREAAQALLAGDSRQDWTVLGFGEFMYLPMLVAYELAQAGVEARFWTTTRSPIRVASRDGYPINAGITFPLPEAVDTTGYLYSVDRVSGALALCPETTTDLQAAPLYEQLVAAGASTPIVLLPTPR
jgi:Phosphoribosyl transferase/TRSP domain C terminus to PRTase_2